MNFLKRFCFLFFLMWWNKPIIVGTFGDLLGGFEFPQWGYIVSHSDSWDEVWFGLLIKTTSCRRTNCFFAFFSRFPLTHVSCCVCKWEITFEQWARPIGYIIHPELLQIFSELMLFYNRHLICIYTFQADIVVLQQFCFPVKT